MVVPQGSSVVWITTSDDFTVALLGPAGIVGVIAGQPIVCDRCGFFTLAVMDRQVRAIEVTVECSLATPKSKTAKGKAGRAIVGFQVK